MVKQFVNELKDGDTVGSPFRLVDIQDGTTKHGKPFKRLKLVDKSGEISSVFWDSASCPEPYKAGDIMWVSGQASLYQGKLQVTISMIAVLPVGLEIIPTDFDKCTAYDVPYLWGKLVDYIGTFDEPWIREVAEDIFLASETDEAFRTVPAATGMHHAFRGGLLEHTVELLDCADALLKLPFFKPLNRDLCMFGLMFHDYGKLYEYSAEPGFKKTLQGVLVPHIPMTAAIIYEVCNKREIPPILRDHLMHVVLAHHGRMECGSPVDMAFPEAAFVHYMDNMHGTVFGYWQKIQAKKGDELVEHWNGKKISLIGNSFGDILKTVRANVAP